MLLIIIARKNVSYNSFALIMFPRVMRNTEETELTCDEIYIRN
jgi:hypothetical protein